MFFYILSLKTEKNNLNVLWFISYSLLSADIAFTMIWQKYIEGFMNIDMPNIKT